MSSILSSTCGERWGGECGEETCRVSLILLPPYHTRTPRKEKTRQDTSVRSILHPSSFLQHVETRPAGCRLFSLAVSYPIILPYPTRVWYATRSAKGSGEGVHVRTSSFTHRLHLMQTIIPAAQGALILGIPSMRSTCIKCVITNVDGALLPLIAVPY